MERRLLLIVCGVIALATRELPLPAAEPPLPAVVDDAWNAAFTRTNGWTGGDVAGSIDLGDDRTLWLFGDTWIGSVADRRHAPSAKLVNNSIAVQTTVNGSAVTPKDFDFRWGNAEDKKEPAAWIVPDAAVRQRLAVLTGEQQKVWYWPTGGGTVVMAPNGKERLIVFLFVVVKQPGKSGVWAFRTVGSAMAIIDNFQEPPEKWRVRQLLIPFSIEEPTTKEGQGEPATTWGVATVEAYIYGVQRESALNQRLFVARVRESQFDQLDEWAFYAGKDRWTKDHWSGDANDAKPIANGVVSELTVELRDAIKPNAFVMVHSEPALGSRIFVRTASRPEGPWSEPKVVYRAPEPDRDKSYFAYAAKGHLDLSQPGELLISYVVNSHDFNKMVNDASIYRPRFVRVKLDDRFAEIGESDLESPDRAIDRPLFSHSKAGDLQSPHGGVHKSRLAARERYFQRGGAAENAEGNAASKYLP